MESSVDTHVYGKLKQGAYPESQKTPVGAASSREIK